MVKTVVGRALEVAGIALVVLLLLGGVRAANNNPEKSSHDIIQVSDSLWDAASGLFTGAADLADNLVNGK